MKYLLMLTILPAVYTYAVYPLSLYIISLLRRPGDRHRRVDPEKAHTPSVSVLVAAFNEESCIEDKIVNCKALDYPADKIEVIIGSDGSTDRTNDICARHSSNTIRFIPFRERRGKAAVLNDLARECKGEVILFTDANTMLKPDTVRRLIEPLQDERVGGTCGRLALTNNKSEFFKSSEAVYWHYETLLKRLEGRTSSVIGANGGIYAIRRTLFTPIPDDTIVDDFVISMNVIKKGFRLVYEERAIGYEESHDDLRADFRRKMRIGAGNIQSLKYISSLLLPSSGFIAFMFWSHKVIRWCIPLILIAFYTAPLFIIDDYPPILLIGQNFLLVLALAGIKYGKYNRFLRLTTYFFSINFALFLGYCRYLMGIQKGAWEKTR